MSRNLTAARSQLVQNAHGKQRRTPPRAKAVKAKLRLQTSKPVLTAPKGQSEVRSIPIGAIDWSFVIRSLNVEHLERLSGASRLPAIKVWEIRPGEYRGIDGYHRWSVARDRHDETVVAVLYRFANNSEGEKAFETECIRCNIHHGLPLTKAERDAAIRRFWERWGKSKDRPNGETLESIGKLFDLTRQRVHQILEESTSADDSAGGRGFSKFARFTAATRRMSTLLADRAFLNDLVRDRGNDVLLTLTELDVVINGVLARYRSQA